MFNNWILERGPAGAGAASWCCKWTMDCYGHENNTLHKLKMGTWLHCKYFVSLKRWSMLKCNALLLPCVVPKCIMPLFDCFDGLSKIVCRSLAVLCYHIFQNGWLCNHPGFTFLLPFSCSLSQLQWKGTRWWRANPPKGYFIYSCTGIPFFSLPCFLLSITALLIQDLSYISNDDITTSVHWCNV